MFPTQTLNIPLPSTATAATTSSSGNNTSALFPQSTSTFPPISKEHSTISLIPETSNFSKQHSTIEAKRQPDVNRVDLSSDTNSTVSSDKRSFTFPDFPITSITESRSSSNFPRPVANSSPRMS